MKEQRPKPKMLYPGSLSFTFEGEIKDFTDKQKLKRVQYYHKQA